MQQTQNRFIPNTLIDFFKERIQEVLGVGVLIATAILCVSVLTFSPIDVSLNTASLQTPSNWLGIIGSFSADIFLQFFGLTTFMCLLIFAIWGYRLVRQQAFALSPIRWFTAFLSLLCFGIILNALPPLEKMFNLAPTTLCANIPNQGGVLSYLLYWNIQKIMITYHVLFLLKPLLLVMFLLGFMLTWYTTGLSLKQLKICLQAIYRSFIFISISTGHVINAILTFKGSRSNHSLINTPHPINEEPVFHKVRFETIDEIPEIDWRQPEDDLDEDTTENTVSTKKTLTPQPKSKKKDFKLPEHLINTGEYNLPPVNILDKTIQKIQMINPDLLQEQAKLLESVLAEFGIRGEIVNIRPGPVVTMYELKPAPGIKTSRVIGLADDIARSMSALSARIAVIPGQNVIGIELPNRTRQTVYLKELLTAEEYHHTKAALPLILGHDIGGIPTITDLTKMPHLLVAGTTGSGKSVAVNAMILSLLFKLPPEKCKFIMIDPKMLELSVYDDIPHLLTPVVTDPKKAVIALKWAVKEMENRYRAMSKLGVRNIDGFNTRLAEAKQTGEVLVRRVQTGFDPETGKPIFENQGLDYEQLPFIVVVVDEMADLMLVAGKEIESTIQRLAQMARAAGIHLIMATQRPSVDVITGTIKANFPTRISFQVTSKIDSRTILGEQGAEQLLGQGDMLYMAGGGRISRVHGPYVRDDEVERVVAFLKTQGDPTYIDGVTDDDEEFTEVDTESKGEGDQTYRQAVEVIMREGKVSTSFIQRHLQIGYNRAARIVEQMEKEGLISPANHAGKREILR